MRCVKGDLAIIINSKNGNCGAEVTCIEYRGELEGAIRTDYWLVEASKPIKCRAAFSNNIKESISVNISASCLMPISPPEQLNDKEFYELIPMLLTEAE